MREPAVMFRLPGHVLANVDALASRLNLSVNMVAKLTVIREIMNTPAMLEEHDKQLANMHQFLREMAFHNEEFLADNEDRRDEAAKAIMAKLNEVINTIDSIRDAAFVRPSTYIEELIRQHDERPIQGSLGA
ncbi:hypothetical protein [Mesorhizobium shangrilense]|uniref:Uncharacterized protein n=1 Tax=Mesorhizobium shangrilense TaxID=460060 RepID=A0ABV2DQL7_9HYPH